MSRFSRKSFLVPKTLVQEHSVTIPNLDSNTCVTIKNDAISPPSLQRSIISQELG